MTQTKPAEATLMYAEAAEAGAAAARFLHMNATTLERIAARLRQSPPTHVTTCARGSSDHAATYGKYLIETLVGVPTSSAAPSVASIFAAPQVMGKALCIAISQSGRSPDLLRSVEAYKQAGAFVVALVNQPESPLAELADEVLPLQAGPERSVAATKSYIASLVALAALVAAWAQNGRLTADLYALPSQLEEAFALDWQEALATFEGATNLFVIGRGYSLAVAQEAALKLKETCGLHAEAFSAAEVRHGPMAIVQAGFPVIAFATSDAAGDGVRDVTEEFLARGARVAIADAALRLPGLATLRANPVLEPILMIQSFYRFANMLSLRRGFDPDMPPHLSKVTQTV
jgi:glucosamine--fructose-6-phosphate aminotransferase (isomerizing)